MKIWAVSVGRSIGVFTCWKDLFASVSGYPDAVYKEFNTRLEADLFLQQSGCKRKACDDDAAPAHAHKKKKQDTDEGPYVLYFDGACKNNGTKQCVAGAGFVIKNKHGTVVLSGTKHMGAVTNNAAEYAALELGLEAAIKMGASPLRVRGDSELVVKQVNGEYKARHPVMAACLARVKQLIDQIDIVVVEHVPRAQNSEADAMANKAVTDKKI